MTFLSNNLESKFRLSRPCFSIRRRYNCRHVGEKSLTARQPWLVLLFFSWRSFLFDKLVLHEKQKQKGGQCSNDVSEHAVTVSFFQQNTECYTRPIIEGHKLYHVMWKEKLVNCNGYLWTSVCLETCFTGEIYGDSRSPQSSSEWTYFWLLCLHFKLVESVKVPVPSSRY